MHPRREPGWRPRTQWLPPWSLPETAERQRSQSAAQPPPCLSPPSAPDLGPVHVFLSSDRSLSDRGDDSAEGAVLNQVTQGICRFGQREGFGHYRFDRAGLEQRDNSIPGVNPSRLWLSEKHEAPDAGPMPD